MSVPVSSPVSSKMLLYFLYAILIVELLFACARKRDGRTDQQPKGGTLDASLSGGSGDRDNTQGGTSGGDSSGGSRGQETGGRGGQETGGRGQVTRGIDAGDDISELCNNGIIDDDEQCDGSDLNGASCESLLNVSGTLTCSTSCRYDTTLCNGDPSTGGNDAGDSGADASEAQIANCCPDGDCLCRGPNPTLLTMERGPYEFTSYELNGDGCVYYPKDADPPFAAVAVADEYTSSATCLVSSVGNWAMLYASHGIVTMLVYTTMIDTPLMYSRALLTGIEALKAENEDSSSPLFRKLAGRFGTSGFSTGGGGTTFAASADPTLKSSIAIMAFAPTGDEVQVPTLFICGSDDSFASCATNGALAYDSMPETTPKMIVTIQSPHMGQPSAGRFMSGAWALAFQKVFLEGDERWRPILLEGEWDDTNIQ